MAPSIIEERHESSNSFTQPKQAVHSVPAQTLDPSKISSDYQINEVPIRHRRPLRVVCMGAGYSGLMMGIIHDAKMKQKNIDFVIYERNEDLGGTWLENK